MEKKEEEEEEAVLLSTDCLAIQVMTERYTDRRYHMLGGALK